MQWKMKLDWLSMTGKIDKKEGDPDEDYLLARVNLSRRLLQGLGLKEPALQTVPPAKYYAVSFVDRQTGVRVNLGENLSSQGWQVVISGQALAEFDFVKYLRYFMEVWQAKVTRADFAIDLLYFSGHIVNIADQYREEHGEDGAKSWSYIKGKTGDTLYIGSRASESMVRIYDKGGEQNVPIDWIRVELEAKGSRAHRLVETFQHDFRQVVAEIHDYIDLPKSILGSILRGISEGQQKESVKTPRVVADRVKWFNGQVLMAYYKLCAERPDEARKVWENFHDVWMAYELWRSLFPDDLTDSSSGDKLPE